METVDRWNSWANTHTNFFTDALRVLFGAFILFKGYYFLSESTYLDEIFRSVGGHQGTFLIFTHYVALSHLCGGFFIMLGLLTRWCALLQMPILGGAVLVNFIGAMNGENLLQATAALIVCSFFVYYGSGRHSVDYNLKLHV